MQRRPDGVLFLLTAPTKTQRGGAPKEFFVSSYADDAMLCPTACLDVYITRTKELRQSSEQPLLITLPRPYHGASTATISRWIKDILKLCGVDTSYFKAHSTRGASSSRARDAGVSLEIVLAAGVGQTLF